ncbi:hypothetical protein [Parazoarcus communis]|uniref:hypothetical protein n=1 Tax=Parazoarcus communis TaxID=41977 RepID=UPI001F24F6AD|nr:hypothetical protein [Parazoarcus communis]
MSNKDIVAEGARHFRDRKHYKNPYESGTDAFNDFERGWVQALKRANLYNASTFFRSGPENDKPDCPPHQIHGHDNQWQVREPNQPLSEMDVNDNSGRSSDVCTTKS